MKQSALLIVGIVALSALVAVGAEELSVDKCLGLIQSTNMSERNQAIHSLKQQREKIVRSLIAAMDGQSPLEVRWDAARALGDCRAPEAIGVLIKNLALEDQRDNFVIGLMTDEEHAAMMHPFSTAVERIGSPAVPTLLEYISADDNTQLIGKYVSILAAIDGREISRLRLQALLDKETDSKKKERIQLALDDLKKLNPAK